MCNESFARVGLAFAFFVASAPVALSQDRLAVEAAAAEAPSAEKPVGGAELDAYLAKPEPDFASKMVTQKTTADGTVSHFELTSQRWQNIVWTHRLMVYEPVKLAHADHMLLFITGGGTGTPLRDNELAMGVALAKAAGCRVAMLHQVPNQPLLGGRIEDDLITETWLKYLASGDTQWPLLFPMVKSAVKAMDALESLATAQQWQPIKGFVVAGASKRGWTSWLTAAADKRIVATAPMVIDMLNFPAQIKNQHVLWGAPSEQVIDYSSKGLIPRDGVPRPGRETKLWEMMDPYHYRSRVKVPKLLIVGASDRYWSADAMNLYWDDLEGQKYIFRGANSGHDLQGNRDAALTTLAAFFRHVVTGQTLPQLSWNHSNADESIKMTVWSDKTPKSAQFWVAESSTMDFRDSRWQAAPLDDSDGKMIGVHRVSEGKVAAAFAELTFEHEALPYRLATLVYYGGQPNGSQPLASPSP